VLKNVIYMLLVKKDIAVVALQENITVVALQENTHYVSVYVSVWRTFISLMDEITTNEDTFLHELGTQRFQN